MCFGRWNGDLGAPHWALWWSEVGAIPPALIFHIKQLEAHAIACMADPARRPCNLRCSACALAAVVASRPMQMTPPPVSRWLARTCSVPAGDAGDGSRGAGDGRGAMWGLQSRGRPCTKARRG
jgi:hypothetical protein